MCEPKSQSGQMRDAFRKEWPSRDDPLQRSLMSEPESRTNKLASERNMPPSDDVRDRGASETGSKLLINIGVGSRPYNTMLQEAESAKALLIHMLSVDSEDYEHLYRLIGIYQSYQTAAKALAGK